MAPGARLRRQRAVPLVSFGVELDPWYLLTDTSCRYAHEAPVEEMHWAIRLAFAPRCQMLSSRGHCADEVAVGKALLEIVARLDYLKHVLPEQCGDQLSAPIMYTRMHERARRRHEAWKAAKRARDAGAGEGVAAPHRRGPNPETYVFDDDDDDAWAQGPPEDAPVPVRNELSEDEADDARFDREMGVAPAPAPAPVADPDALTPSPAGAPVEAGAAPPPAGPTPEATPARSPSPTPMTVDEPPVTTPLPPAPSPTPARAPSPTTTAPRAPATPVAPETTAPPPHARTAELERARGSYDFRRGGVVESEKKATVTVDLSAAADGVNVAQLDGTWVAIDAGYVRIDSGRLKLTVGWEPEGECATGPYELHYNLRNVAGWSVVVPADGGVDLELALVASPRVAKLNLSTNRFRIVEDQEDDGVYDEVAPGGDLTRCAARIIISGPAGLQAAWKDVVTKAVPLQTGGIAGGGIPEGHPHVLGSELTENRERLMQAFVGASAFADDKLVLATSVEAIARQRTSDARIYGRLERGLAGQDVGGYRCAHCGVALIRKADGFFYTDARENLGRHLRPDTRHGPCRVSGCALMHAPWNVAQGATTAPPVTAPPPAVGVATRRRAAEEQEQARTADLVLPFADLHAILTYVRDVLPADRPFPQYATLLQLLKPHDRSFSKYKTPKKFADACTRAFKKPSQQWYRDLAAAMGQNTSSQTAKDLYDAFVERRKRKPKKPANAMDTTV